MLAALAGAILPFAFAPYEIRPIAYVSPAILFYLWRTIPPGRIYISGFLFQLGFFAVGVHWVYYSIHLFGHAVAPLAVLVTALFVVGLSVICSLSGLLFKWLGRDRDVLISALLFTAAWSAFEWLRGWLFGGFPWLLIGYSQIDTWFSGFAPLVGVYGIGFFLVLCTSLVTAALISVSTSMRIASLSVVAIIIAAAMILEPVEWGRSKEQPLRVRMVQGNIKQQVKFDRDALVESLDLYTRLSERNTEEKPNLIIWPETAIPTVFKRVERYLQPFVKKLETEKIELLSGGFKVDENDRVYNAFRQMGGEKQTYLKSHLVPFGEFMPFRFILDFLSAYIDIPMSDLSSGPMIQAPMRIQGEKIGLSICYEDVFGEEMRFQLPESTILVNVSNDTWFGDSAAPYQHQEIAAMRAREFSRALIRVTNTGVSSFISHRGEVEQSIPQFEQGFSDKRVMPREGLTPYALVGNYPVIFLFGITLLVAALGRMKKTPLQ